jgi:hypothetical protein
LWEELASSAEPSWPSALDRVLRARAGLTLSELFADFARVNLYTGTRADPSVAYARGGAYPAVAESVIELPFYDDLVRMAPLSARYFVTTLAAELTLVAALGAAGEDLTGLRLLLARERGGSIVEVVGGPDALGLRATLHGLASDRVHIVSIDTRVSGATLHPWLCIGPPTDVAACEAAQARADPGAPTPVDSGVSDAGEPRAPGLDTTTEVAAASDAQAPAAADSSLPPPATGERAHGGGCALPEAPEPGDRLAPCWLGIWLALCAFPARQRRLLFVVRRWRIGGERALARDR